MVTTRSQSKKLAKEVHARPSEQEKAEAKNQHQPNRDLKEKNDPRYFDYEDWCYEEDNSHWYSK